MEPGKTYLCKDGSGEHLWIVISSPDDTTKEVVVVNFTSHQEYKDQTCIVEAGEHPFVKHKTIVAYNFARVLNTSEQVAFVKMSRPCEDVSAELLQRIQEGTDSDYMPLKAAKLVIASCKKQRLADKATK